MSDIVRILKSGVGDDWVKYEGIVGLASIGTPETEQALLGMDWAPAGEWVRGLVCFGSLSTVAKAIDIAKQNGGPRWLLDNVRYGFMILWQSDRHFITDIEIEPLLKYVSETTADVEVTEYLESIIDGIDSPAVRDQYFKWLGRRGTSEDLKLKSPDMMLSELAERELMRRGDERVLPQFIDREIVHSAKYRVSEHVIEQFAMFDRVKVIDALRQKLALETDPKRQVAALDLIGRLGDPSDAPTLRQLATSSISPAVSNAALEAALRLTDPLRLAEHW